MIRCRESGPGGSVRSALARPRPQRLLPRLRADARASRRPPSSRSLPPRSSLRMRLRPSMVRQLFAVGRRRTSPRNRPSTTQRQPPRLTRLPRLRPRTPPPWRPPRRRLPRLLLSRRQRPHMPRPMSTCLLLPRRRRPRIHCRRRVRHRLPAPRRPPSSRCHHTPVRRRARSKALAAAHHVRPCVLPRRGCLIARARQAPASRPAVVPAKVAETSVGRARWRPQRLPSAVPAFVRQAGVRRVQLVLVVLRAPVQRHAPAGILAAVVARKASAARSIRPLLMQIFRRR